MGDIHHLVLRHGKGHARNLVQGVKRRRLVEIAAEVLEEESRAIGITYSGFCLTALPHRRLPDDRHWVRTSPRVTLMVEPGRLPHDERLHGVPYGSRARLILLYLQTRAIQTGSAARCASGWAASACRSAARATATCATRRTASAPAG